MGFYNFYVHLDKDIAPAPFNMDDIAEWAINQIDGLHRMLCALVRAKYKNAPDSELAKAVEAAVNKYTI